MYIYVHNAMVKGNQYYGKDSCFIVQPLPQNDESLF